MTNYSEMIDIIDQDQENLIVELLHAHTHVPTSIAALIAEYQRDQMPIEPLRLIRQNAML